MHNFLVYFCTGILVGAIDALPMWIKKRPKEKCLSAFIQYIIVTLIIFYANVEFLPWWIEGSVIALGALASYSHIDCQNRESIYTYYNR